MARNRLSLLRLLVVIAVAVALSACSAGRGPRTARDRTRFISQYDLQHLPRFDIPVELNDRVIAWMEYFQGPGSAHFRRYLERSGRYMALMQDILKKYGMPKDLIYIALIESGFNTQAYSRSAAVGPWQFISSTARRYGLRIDGWIDERRDPYKSTLAAIQYFRDLYAEFGDWYLAMAGYNAGEGRVRQAIETTGSRNFWEIAENRSVLRAETRDYVPKFIAAAIMAKMPERFGFGRIDYRAPFDFDTGTVETQTDLGAVAKCAGVGEDDILDLNPHLYRGATPPDAYNYEIRLPRGTAKAFQQRYAALPKEERIQVVRYEVRRGDTLAKVARRFGVSASALASANGISPRQRYLNRGMSLVIPAGAAAKYAAYADNRDGARDQSAGSKKQVRHTVGRGETLGAIARRYGVTTKQIMTWNNIRNPKKMHKGMSLVVRRSKSLPDTTAVALDEAEGVQQKGQAQVAGKEHKVQRGDTLSTIARRYGVTVKQIMALNDIGNPKNVRPGMNLIIRPGREAPPAGAPVQLAGSAGSKKSAAQVHKVKPGETIGGIAQRYNVSAKDLMAMNNIRDPRGVRAGANLVVQPAAKKIEQPPQGAKAPAAKADAAAVEAPAPSLAPAVPAEPIAPAGQGASQSLSDRLMEGVQAVPPGPKAASASTQTAVAKAPEAKDTLTYRVKNGDTLWDIARRHKVTIAQIQKWNNLSDPSSVKPGATLTIYRD